MKYETLKRVNRGFLMRNVNTAIRWACLLLAAIAPLLVVGSATARLPGVAPFITTTDYLSYATESPQAPRPGVAVADPDCEERLWAGVNNGDIFDETEEAEDLDKRLGALLDELAAADLKVIRILIDYRLDLDDDDHDGDGNADALPIGEYNDCVLQAIDRLMLALGLTSTLKTA